MKIAIIDDMAADCQQIYDYVIKYCKSEHIHVLVDTYESGRKFLSSFEEGKYNLIFLDIYLNNLNGIEIATELRKIDDKCLIVFSTSSQAHAIKGYRVRAFDYLVKPHTYSSFRETMSLCAKALQDYSEYIEVKEGREYTKIFIEDIIYTDYHNHYVQIHTAHSVIRSYMPFPVFQEMLQDYPQFICCYRNCLVNMSKVDELDDCTFVMKNGEQVPISKKKKNEIRQIYADYVFSCISGNTLQ